MTGRDRIEAAFSEDGAREFGAVIPYESIFIRDHWNELTSCPWWYAHETDLERQLAWRREVIGRTGLDWFSVSACASREEREYIHIEEREDGVFQVNDLSGQRRKLKPPEVGDMGSSGEVLSVHPEQIPESREQIDLLIPEPPPFDARRFAADGRADLSRRMLEGVGRVRYPLGFVPSPLWCTYGLWGFEGLMTMTVDRPDVVERACERYLAHAEYGAKVSKALGAAGVWIEECMTDMLGPGEFRRLNLPFVRRLVESIREAGMRSIYYFCGNPAGKWDMILDTGADAVSLEEGKKGFAIDIDEVVERVDGRCAVLGNVDAIGLLPDATEEGLRTELERQARAGRRNGSRFIMSLGSPVTPGTSVERVRRYAEMTHKVGRGV